MRRKAGMTKEEQAETVDRARSSSMSDIVTVIQEASTLFSGVRERPPGLEVLSGRECRLWIRAAVPFLISHSTCWSLQVTSLTARKILKLALASVLHNSTLVTSVPVRG